MTHRDRAGGPPGQRAGRREAAGPAGHPPSAAAAPLLRRTGRQGFPTPPQIRPLPVRLPDRNGGFPRLWYGVPHGLRCPASPRHALLAESPGKPSLWVFINAPWYYLGNVSYMLSSRDSATTNRADIIG